MPALTKSNLKNSISTTPILPVNRVEYCVKGAYYLWKKLWGKIQLFDIFACGIMYVAKKIS